MYRICLTEEQRQQLAERTQHKTTAPKMRARLEMLRLSDKGWSVPRIAAHLEVHEQTVRYWIKAFLAGSFAALTDKPHTGRKPGITPEILAVVREWLTKADRTWNARQVASEVHTRYGVMRSVAQWQRLLRRQQMRYKPTRRTLHHKQNVEQVAVRRAELDVLKRGQTADNWTCVTSTKQVLH